MIITQEVRLEAIERSKQLLEEKGTYERAASSIGVAPPDIWRAINREYVSPALVKGLGLIKIRKRYRANIEFCGPGEFGLFRLMLKDLDMTATEFCLGQLERYLEKCRNLGTPPGTYYQTFFGKKES